VKFVQPALFNLASTRLNIPETTNYLSYIGAPDWTTNASSDAEALIEMCGKSCYRSFSTDLNPNLTKVRTNQNPEYIKKGIVEVGHGSVLEHVHETFAMVGVTRVLTHETVRHRIANYSQESLRFVRLTELSAYFPDAFRQPFIDRLNEQLATAGENPIEVNEDWMKNQMTEVFEYLEAKQYLFAERLQLDKLERFADKKKLTSGLRRMAPIGLATAIIMTTNLRQWRLIIEKRTNAAAEEEIRKATARIFHVLAAKHPATFADAETTEIDGTDQVKFLHNCG
jgi:thymidylate synthase (FAD)